MGARAQRGAIHGEISIGIGKHRDKGQRPVEADLGQHHIGIAPGDVEIDRGQSRPLQRAIGAAQEQIGVFICRHVIGIGAPARRIEVDRIDVRARTRAGGNGQRQAVVPGQQIKLKLENFPIVEARLRRRVGAWKHRGDGRPPVERKIEAARRTAKILRGIADRQRVASCRRNAYVEHQRIAGVIAKINIACAGEPRRSPAIPGSGLAASRMSVTVPCPLAKAMVASSA